MPISPFHFAIGAVTRSVTPHRFFSFQVFLLSQVLIDIQPGMGLFLDWDELHGWTHTYPGALVIALATALIWMMWERYRPTRFDNGHVRGWILAYTALLGTISHVWMDSQFHAEMARLTRNWMKLWETGDATTSIETFCLALFFLSAMIWIARRLSLMLWRRYGKFLSSPNVRLVHR